MNNSGDYIQASGDCLKELIRLKKASNEALILDIKEKLQIEMPEEEEKQFMHQSEKSLKNSLPQKASYYNGKQSFCFYKEAISISALNLEGELLCNNFAKSIDGWGSEYKKKHSSHAQGGKEINLACVSGQYLTTIYPNENDLLFGITFNETCGIFTDQLVVPEGFVIKGSSLFLTTRLKIADQSEKNIFTLSPGKSGSRLHDLVGVHGNIILQVSYNNKQSWVSASKLFLLKYQAEGRQEFGDFDRIVDIPVTIPLHGNWINEYPHFEIRVIVNISTFTGQNFIPEQIRHSCKQYALIDLRELNNTSPFIIPDHAKRGSGGVTIQWYKLCFSDAKESPA